MLAGSRVDTREVKTPTNFERLVLSTNMALISIAFPLVFRPRYLVAFHLYIKYFPKPWYYLLEMDS